MAHANTDSQGSDITDNCQGQFVHGFLLCYNSDNADSIQPLAIRHQQPYVHLHCHPPALQQCVLL